MRVLLLNQTFYPDQVATSQQLLDFAQHLQNHGCEVTVMTSRRAYSDPKTVYPADQNLGGIRVVRVWSTGFGKRSFFLRFLDALSFEFLLLCRLLLFKRQDCVVAFTSPPLIGFIAVLFTFLRGGQCVQWMMDLNPDIAFEVGYLDPKSFRGYFLTWVFRITARASDCIVVLDRWMRSRMIGHGVCADRIIVVPPWPVVDPEVGSAEMRERFRKRHGIHEPFVVLYSGNHSIAHPLDTLLEAALALRENKEVLFLFIGGGLRANEVSQFAKAHALTNIRQLPHQPRELLKESLSIADIHTAVMGSGMSGLVHLSKIYGVLASGRPYIFIGPKASHVGDLLEEYPFGLQVEHGNSAAVAQGIEHIRKLSPEALKEIGSKNREYVSKNSSAAQSLSAFFSWQKGISTYLLERNFDSRMGSRR